MSNFARMASSRAKVFVLTACGASGCIISNAPAGLSTPFRFRLPGFDGEPKIRFWNFEGETLDGEIISISSSLNPSLCGRFFFFFGVTLRSFFPASLALFSCRTLSDSSARSLLIKSRSVAAFFSLLRACSRAYCCFASFSSLSFLKLASCLSNSLDVFSCLLRTIEISPAFALSSFLRVLRSLISYKHY